MLTCQTLETCSLPHLGAVHINNLRVIWKRSFTLKTHQMYSVNTTLEEFKNSTITGHFGFVFEENSAREITWCHRLRKATFSNRPYKNENSAFKFLRFEKLRFRDGLVWHLGIIIHRNKAVFQIPNSVFPERKLVLTICQNKPVELTVESW